MKQSSPVPPIIIIGMHRSGTSVVTRLLARLGLYAGDHLDSNHEAIFFYRANEWLLRLSGATWDYPEPVAALLADREARAMAAECINAIMSGRQVSCYLGWRNYLRHRHPSRLPFPWGWKDPRNTYTLPLWLDLFPDAKVVHVCRNGVDVARSLQVRAAESRQSFRTLYLAKGAKLWSHRRRRDALNFFRCSQLEAAFGLWEAYLRQARLHLDRMPKSQTIEVRYEAVLETPVGELTSLARFCGLPATTAQLHEVADLVQRDRAWAYSKSAELSEFAERVTHRLSSHGFGLRVAPGNPQR